MKYLTRQVDLDLVKKRRRRFRRRFFVFGLIFLGTAVLGGFLFFRTEMIRAVFTPISFVARLVSPVELKEADGRVNALILGLDTRGSGGLMNTDSILVGSFSSVEGKPVLISIPRDLWVNLSPYGYGKINAAYSRGGTQSGGKFDEEKGVKFAKDKIEEILGIDIPYWVVVDFEAFRQIINTLGGIEVCVERAFEDYAYPVPGKEAADVISDRYEYLSFKAGCQKMNGETALKYARSRTGTNGEGSDFARVRRQQRVVLGMKDKLLSINLLLNLSKLAKLYDQVTATVKTNVTLGEVQRGLEIVAKLEDLSELESLVLDPESQLVYRPSNPAPYGGAYVLVPQGSDFKKIRAAVRKILYGGAEKQ